MATSTDRTAAARARRPVDPSHASHPDPLLTTIEAANYLRLAPDTLKRYRYLGVGPTFLRAGRAAIRYRRSALDAWMTREAA
jgi:hypothetical protein